MDPITSLIVTAVASGAAAALESTVAEAIKDTYAGLKKLMIERFVDHQNLIDSMEYLTKKPEDKLRQASFGQELNGAGATKDPDVTEAAEAVLAAIKDHKPETYAAIGLDIEEIEAEILEVKKIRASGTGVKMKKAKIKGKASFTDITAGQTGSSDPN